MITNEDLEKRFAYHAPKDEKVQAQHTMTRTAIALAARTLINVTPEGREQSLAITKLEEAMMWANAAIARNQG